MTDLTIQMLDSRSLHERLPAYVDARVGSASHDPRWLLALEEGLRHVPYCLEATRGGTTVGVLPLVLVKSLLFGRFLVGLSYLNSGGVRADDADVARALIDRAVELADQLRVKHLELRHETELVHERLPHKMESKVHMRLALPGTGDELWTALKAAVRNQIRKGEKQNFTIHWGREELLADFYAVFSENMRDLGTPVFGRSLFVSILRHFANEAELCVLRDGQQPVAAALLIHGPSVTEVPSASALRRYNPSNPNMLMYWQLLRRAIERGNRVFDFGRSTVDAGTFKFKKQWGAVPEPAIWQYYARQGEFGGMRPDSPKFQLAIRVWRKLPLWVTRLVGPLIVRGIP